VSIAEIHGAPVDYDRGGPSGRTPPQDENAEQSVLGAMLLSKDAIADVVEVIRGTDFYRPGHELIYDAVLDLYGRGEPADAITVSNELTRSGDLARVGGAPYLHTLVAGVPVAANAGYYAGIVREKAILRRLIDAGTRIIQFGYSEEGLVDDVGDRAQAEVYGVTDKRTSEDYAPLSDIMELTIDELEAIGNRDGAMAGVPTGFAELDELTNGLHGGQMIVVAARPAVGKALALDTPLPTPSGWTTMGDVAVGDELIDADGRPTRVVAATEVMTGRPCYEVTFSDGTTIIADGQHQWLTETRTSRKSEWAARNHYNRTRNKGTFPSVTTTEEIAATLTADVQGRLNHSIANARPVEGTERRLLLPPYALGVWLGDGHTAGARFTSVDPEIPMYVESSGLVVRRQSETLYSFGLHEEGLAEIACEVCGVAFLPRDLSVRTCGRACGARIRNVAAPAPTCPDCGVEFAGLAPRCTPCRAHHGTVTARLRTLGVLGDKHIPDDYLRAAERQRRELLAGLLDTDGTVVKPSGSVQFAVTHERLADDVYELITSLGYRCSRTTKRVRGRTEASSTAFILTFSTCDDVFRLPRKQLLHKELRPTSTVRIGRRYITGVRRITSVPVRCVQVDNADHLYLAGRAMIPTHNSTIALDFARSASIKHGLTSAIFSLEMSKTEITMRLLSAEARIPLNHMRNGKMNDDDWNKLVRKMGEVSEAPLFIDDSPNLTMMEIRAKARRLKQRHDLRFIIIDYLQLMTSGKKVESRQLEVSEFSRQIKLLAKELDVPVIAVSQLNRGSEQRTSKRPMLSDLRESGSIEQDADMVILLHREDIYEKESTRPGEADIIVAKHRNGPTKDIVLAFQGHYSRFVDMAQG
jgi:replicative DNA helicase